jgi:hypothetical protein
MCRVLERYTHRVTQFRHPQALASAISDELQVRQLGSEFIDQIIRRANGLDGLIALYSSFGRELPVSPGNVRANLAGVRNEAAHAGRVPSTDEATRAVELAHALVSAAHPLAGELSLAMPA